MGLQPLLPKHRKNKEKRLILLADPDKINAPDFLLRFSAPLQAAIDVVLVGGSLIQRNTIESLIREFKAACATPVYLFPGSPLQLAPNADGILFLSLISGRNPEYLIGRHIEAAPLLKAYNFDVIPTGYILIEGGQTSSTAYITQTQPIPSGKPDLAVATALAGQFLGMRLIYLEAGSGAQTPRRPPL
jgi:putative glycerol-1-phosphate prenyltransferase